MNKEKLLRYQWIKIHEPCVYESQYKDEAKKYFSIRARATNAILIGEPKMSFLNMENQQYIKKTHFIFLFKVSKTSQPIIAPIIRPISPKTLIVFSSFIFLPMPDVSFSPTP